MLTLLALTLAPAHVFIRPQSGHATGGYVREVNVRVSAGKDGFTTTKVELDVPKGVTSIVPIQMPGWNTEVTSVALPDGESYSTHGSGSSTERPDKIVFTAKTADDGIVNGNVGVFTFGFWLGCDLYNEAESDSTFNGALTLWWSTKQSLSPVGTLDMAEEDVIDHSLNCGLEGFGSVYANYSPTGPSPCPYIQLYSSPSCSVDDEEGTRFRGALVPPAENMDAVENEQQVIDLVVAETSATFDTLVARIAAVESGVSTNAARIDDNKDNDDKDKDKESDKDAADEAAPATLSATSGTDPADNSAQLAVVGLVVAVLALLNSLANTVYTCKANKERSKRISHPLAAMPAKLQAEAP